MRSRVLTTLLALGLVTALTPAAAFAAEDVYLGSFAPATGNTITIDPTTIATITDPDTKNVVQYKSLKDAIDVADGRTIVLQQDCSEPVEVKKSITFAIKLNGHTFTGEITAPNEFTIAKKTTASEIIYTVTAPIASDSDKIDPVAGIEASDTSVEIAKTAFPDGSDWAIIACSTDFADAMSATGLAGTLDCPILITDIHELSPAVLEEIERLGAKNVYIIGGKIAIPGDIEEELAAVGVTASRVYGQAAWDTSVACANKVVEHNGNPDNYAILTTSDNFQDALSMSSFAFKYKVPVFITTAKKALTAGAKKALTDLTGTIYVPGGQIAVPASIAEKTFGDRVIRIWGQNGYDTSNQIADYMVENELLGNEVVCVACGALATKGLDALCGSALAGKNDAVVLLVNGDTIYEPVNTTVIRGDDSEGTEAFITHNASEIKKAYILGGPLVVPMGIRNTIQAIIG